MKVSFIKHDLPWPITSNITIRSRGMTMPDLWISCHSSVFWFQSAKHGQKSRKHVVIVVNVKPSANYATACAAVIIRNTVREATTNAVNFDAGSAVTINWILSEDSHHWNACQISFIYIAARMQRLKSSFNSSSFWPTHHCGYRIAHRPGTASHRRRCHRLGRARLSAGCRRPERSVRTSDPMSARRRATEHERSWCPTWRPSTAADSASCGRRWRPTRRRWNTPGEWSAKRPTSWRRQRHVQRTRAARQRLTDVRPTPENENGRQSSTVSDNASVCRKTSGPKHRVAYAGGGQNGGKAVSLPIRIQKKMQMVCMIEGGKRL